jgi:hypothetical protein
MRAAEELLQETPAARPCVHPRAHHEHGSLQAYRQDQCRCSDCINANYLYHKHRKLRLAEYGSWTAYADAEPVRAHVLSLIDAGLGLKPICRTAGVSRYALRRLLRGNPVKGIPPSVRVLDRTAKKLLAVSYPQPVHEP